MRACLRALCKTRILHGWIADMRTPSSPCGSCDKVVGACRAQCRLTVPPRLINLMSERRCECRYHVAALFPARAAVQARLPILRPVEGPLLPRARIPILAPKPRVVIARHLVGTVGPALHHRRVASTVLGEPDACDPHGQTCESQHVMFALFGCRVGAGWGVRMWKKIMLPQPTTSTTA